MSELLRRLGNHSNSSRLASRSGLPLGKRLTEVILRATRRKWPAGPVPRKVLDEHPTAYQEAVSRISEPAQLAAANASR